MIIIFCAILAGIGFVTAIGGLAIMIYGAAAVGPREGWLSDNFMSWNLRSLIITATGIAIMVISAMVGAFLTLPWQ